MPYRRIPIDALEVDGNLMYTARASLYVHVLAGHPAPESWKIEAKINGRVDAAPNVSITAQCADRTYRGRGTATERVNSGGRSELEIQGVGPLEGFVAD